jgi:hypothetical protein
LVSVAAVKKVVDASGYKFDELAEYLEASPANIAVLTDYFGMEAFKREGLNNVRSAFLPFLGHERQVVILKPTRTISLLRPRSKGLERRLVDEEQTAGFPFFLHKLLRTPAPEARSILQQFERKQAKAKAMMEGFTQSASLLQSDDGMFAAGRKYPPEILSAIRSGGSLPDGFGHGVITHILQIASGQMDGLFPGHKPSLNDALYSFPFRYTVAMYAMNLHWTMKGDVRTAPAKKVRNDATDMTYVAFGTFFDGVITADKKLADAYNLTRGLLRQVFHV